jgi:exodeoxyribonuclease-3
VRIATFNINDINKRLDNLIDWLAETEPDVACLQELKVDNGAFPHEILEELGYHAVWEGQRTWNGVAILARSARPIVTRRRMPGQPSDTQARYIEAAVGGVLVTSIYLPNGNPHPGPKFDYKLAWFERLIAHAESLVAAGAPVVLAGDFNVVPAEVDIYQPHSWKDDALLHPKARSAWGRLVKQGWTDAVASLPPQGHAPWTFWSYLRQRWPADKGLRIDHLLLSPSLAPHLSDCGIDRWVREEADASDHAPVWIEVEL